MRPQNNGIFTKGKKNVKIKENFCDFGYLEKTPLATRAKTPPVLDR